MSRLPQVSGADIARLLKSLGYQFVRQRGSHARYALSTQVSTHKITIPMHRVIANRELRSLVQLELIKQQSTRRWASYILNVPTEVKPAQTAEEKILDYVRENSSITRAQCKQLIGLTEVQARYLLQKMRKGGFLRLVESGRGARYVLP